MARVYTANRPAVVRDSDVVEVDRGRSVISQVIWFVAGIILILLALRFIFALLGANPGNGFVNFIYSSSHPFVAPFFGIFSYNNYQLGAARFEIYTLVAIFIYAAIAWGLTALVNIGRRY